MTTLRGVLKKLFGSGVSETRDETRRVDYSYRVFWMKQARDWDADTCRKMSERLDALMSDTGFEANAFERRYRVEGVDGEHSGASLRALDQVLEALDAAR
jgi:hypothetical protein